MTEFHPIQWPSHSRAHGAIHELPAAVTKAAYEVYHHLYPSQTLERLNERSGFGIGEVVAFLYARGFPKAEWDRRVQEAFQQKPAAVAATKGVVNK